MRAAIAPNDTQPDESGFNGRTGGTGYIGQALIRALLERGYFVSALVRQGSQARRRGPGAVPIVGDVLDASTYASKIPPQATLVHLVGTPHPNPAKAAEFRNVDLASVIAATTAARHAKVRHLIYVSVAHPAPVMQAYIAARIEGEAAVYASGIPATIMRPGDVVVPGASLALSAAAVLCGGQMPARDPRDGAASCPRDVAGNGRRFDALDRSATGNGTHIVDVSAIRQVAVSS